MSTDHFMEEIWERKEKLSLLYLSQTPEENQRDTEKALKRAEAALGRPLRPVAEVKEQV